MKTDRGVLLPPGLPANSCIRAERRRRSERTVFAAAGTAAGAGISLDVLGLGLLPALGPTLGGAGLFGAAGLGWYRWLYRRALRKSIEEVDNLLTAIEGQLRARAARIARRS